ncbi:MAG: PIG-L family deacetylase [Rubrivivax sp.]|nr:PIG-L family deacetylase [Rubrivivax sp.]
MTINDPGEDLVQIRPHYRRQGNLVYFMISKRATLELAQDELELFDAIDGRTSFSELARRFPTAVQKIHHWQSLEIVELIPPLAAPERPHLVVIEPHMDDAALSVGGRLLHRRGNNRITILSVIKKSNYTSYFYLKREYFDVDKITSLRLEESRLAAALFGAEYSCLNFEDAPLRFREANLWSLDTLENFSEAAGAYTDTSPTPGAVNAIAESLLPECEKLSPDEIWIPMGLGSHIDHRATRSACMKVAAKLRLVHPNLKISVYEDLPYSAVNSATYSAEEHAVAMCNTFGKHGTRLVRRFEAIDDVFDRKIRAISVFASQFKGSVMEPKIRQCASLSGSNALSETYYDMEGSLRLPRESELAPDSSALIPMRDIVSALLRGREKITRVAVILLPSSHIGKWDEDQRTLLTAFPKASFHLYLPEGAAWEVDTGIDERVTVTVVPDGPSGLLSVLRREFYRFGTPTILVSWGAFGGGSAGKQRLLKAALPLRRVILSRTLGDFCALIAEESPGP